MVEKKKSKTANSNRYYQEKVTEDETSGYRKKSEQKPYEVSFAQSNKNLPCRISCLYIPHQPTSLCSCTTVCHNGFFSPQHAPGNQHGVFRSDYGSAGVKRAQGKRTHTTLFS